MKVDIELVRESFKAIKPHADVFAEQFYQELFLRCPEAEMFFGKAKMPKQKKAFMATLTHIVDFWDETAHLEDYLTKMGARSWKYIAQEAHFPLAGEALLAAFEYFFEDQWTSDLGSQWMGVFHFAEEHIVKGMKAAAERPHEAQEAAGLSLEEMARQLARQAFQKALEEASSSMQEIAQGKAQEILRKALEAEAKEVMRSVLKKAA